MKHCPECSAQYDDNVSFCAKDGRALAGLSAAASRLCPHCANSIAEDASQCPYCKADLGAPPSPQWLIRDESPFQKVEAPRRAMMPKLMLAAGIVLCLIAASLLGAGILGKNESGGTRELLEQKIKELQTREEHIQAMEAELNKLRLEAADMTKENVALKARLEESQKERAASDQRLVAARRELEGLSARRARVETRNDPRPVERAPLPARPAQRPAEAGVYETLRSTDVHEQPAQASRVIFRIPGGTRINVVRSDGEWLEIVSRKGNPPGFIRREHAQLAAAK
jgi:hypothetical protein